MHRCSTAEAHDPTIDSANSATSLASKQSRTLRPARTNFGCSKDLRKTCATYYDEHVPESSVEILGHSVGGITYRHYAHRAPLAYRAIMTLPQPTAFSALVNGLDGECPCCRRRFADAA